MTGVRLVVVQHESATGLGAFADVLRGEVGVTPEVIRVGKDPLPEPHALDGVIVLGGSIGASDSSLADERTWIASIAAAGVPYLGICLGAQLLAAALDGRIVPAHRPEIGIHEVVLTDAGRRDPLLRGLPNRPRVFQWHSDTFTLPRGGVPLAGSVDYGYQAFRWGAVAYGVQFHPEATVKTVAAWPWVPAYLDQLQTAGIDSGALLAEVAAEEQRLRELARQILGNWLLISVQAANESPTRAARAGSRWP